ncbi:hypothetical protein Ancab_016421 [Ancistrocladus abbreviatus]
MMVTKAWGSLMAIDDNTKRRRHLEFARILIHKPSIDSINSAVRIQVDRAIVSVWVAEEGMLLDSHEILRGCKERFPLASVSKSYVEDSMIGKSLTGYRSSEVKVVDICQTENQSGGRSSLADLSVTLQKGYGEGFLNSVTVALMAVIILEIKEKIVLL